MALSNKIHEFGDVVKRSAKICVVPLLLAGTVPVEVMGATECPADLQLSIESDSDIFAIGERVPIKVEFTMGETLQPTTFYLSRFQHLLDCEGATDFDECQANGGVPGNVIRFVEGSENTNCTVEGVPPGVVVGVSDGMITVDFTFEDANSVAGPALLESTNVPNTFNSCEVTFDVVVEELSSELVEREIIEWTGFSKDDAVCRLTDDPDDPRPLESESEEQLSFRISNPNSVIWVTKDFTDDNKSEVSVHLRCNAGTILNPDFDQLSDPAANGTFDTVGFIVYNIPSIGADCTVFEDPVPSGYAASYLAGAAPGAEYDDLGELDDDEGCFYTALKSGEFFCDVTNTGEPAMFTVYKEWIVHGTGGGSEVVEEADVTITCDSEIFENKLGDDADENEVQGVVIPPTLPGGDWMMKGTLGDDEFMTAKVDTSDGEANCSASESIQESGVESIDDCAKSRELGPGESANCKFINTVFFEGIPTLNQYGMALMMLLMLGLGFYTFRKSG
jgi:hypothetical protein